MRAQSPAVAHRRPDGGLENNELQSRRIYFLSQYLIICSAHEQTMISSAALIGPELKGRDKWLGGELGCDGNIYGVRFNCLTTTNRNRPIFKVSRNYFRFLACSASTC